MSSNVASLASKGTELYKKGTTSTLAPVLKRDYLEQAVRAFTEAIQYSPMLEDYVLLQKNIGMAAYQIVDTLHAKEQDQRSYWIGKALCHLSVAAQAAKSKMPQNTAIIEKTLGAIETCYTLVTNETLSHPYPLKLEYLRKLLQSVSPTNIPTKQAQTWCLSFLGENAFNYSVVELEKKNFKHAIGLLNDCFKYLRECIHIKKIEEDGEDVEAINDRLDGANTMMCVCESLMEIHVADKSIAGVLEEVEYNEEIREKYVDLLWDMADRYKHALLLTRGRDVENEAIAHSRLGRVFGRFLRDKQKAHDHYRQALEIAETLKPRVMTGHDCAMLQKYQEEIKKEEASEQESIKEPFLKELQPELDALRVAYNNNKKEFDRGHGVADFLDYVYKTHPPPNGTGQTYKRPTEYSDATMKKILRTSILHYHPDKHGEVVTKWTVLCEEITKLLNWFHSSYKAVVD